MSVEEKVRLTHVLTHPARYQIAKLLQSKGRAYIAEIAKDLGVDRKVVTFHMRIMEREGLLTTSLQKKQPPKGNPILVRYAKLTDKAVKTLENCKI